MTTSYKTSTITLNPVTNTVNYVDSKSKCDTVGFIDEFGSIDKEGPYNYYDKQHYTLKFWTPPDGRPRNSSGDYPEITATFPDEASCVRFKDAVESGRDSFK